MAVIDVRDCSDSSFRYQLVDTQSGEVVQQADTPDTLDLIKRAAAEMERRHGKVFSIVECRNAKGGNGMSVKQVKGWTQVSEKRAMKRVTANPRCPTRVVRPQP